MDDDYRELLRRLFVMATEVLETAHDTATTGQSGALSPDDYAQAARRLRELGQSVVALAEAATVVARSIDGNDENKLNPFR
jgi:hypothetical protein